MDTLLLYINQLKYVNDELLFAIDCKMLENNRLVCIDHIDKTCQLIKQTDNYDKEVFVELIKKYIIIQEDYKNAKIHLGIAQLQIRDPNLTENECKQLIIDGYDVHNYITTRNKELIKLEQSIQEVKELFIATYALVEVQGEQIDRIADAVTNAKHDVKSGNNDLITAYKIKQKKWYLFKFSDKNIKALQK
jgi:t-SNARE complex subunit (syntaxin)